MIENGENTMKNGQNVRPGWSSEDENPEVIYLVEVENSENSQERL